MLPQVHPAVAVNNATFTIRGIESDEEMRRIEAELDALDGVMETTIDPDSGEAEVSYDADLLAEERVKITVRDLGYEVQ